MLSGFPYIEISRYEGDGLDGVPGDKSLYDSAEDMEDVAIGSFTWQGFTYEYYGLEGAVIWATEGDTGYRLTISYNRELDLADPDVQEIIGSLK